jgi:hypothetical protein
LPEAETFLGPPGGFAALAAARAAATLLAAAEGFTGLLMAPGPAPPRSVVTMLPVVAEIVVVLVAVDVAGLVAPVGLALIAPAAVVFGLFAEATLGAAVPEVGLALAAGGPVGGGWGAEEAEEVVEPVREAVEPAREGLEETGRGALAVGAAASGAARVLAVVLVVVRGAGSATAGRAEAGLADGGLVAGGLVLVLDVVVVVAVGPAVALERGTVAEGVRVAPGRAGPVLLFPPPPA